MFAGIGTVAFVADQRMVESALHAEGMVVALDLRSGNDGSVYAPVVRWQDRSGIAHEFTSRAGSNPAAYEQGETVPVIYPPDEPGRAKIDGFWDRYLLPLIFAGLGSVFTVIGALLVGSYLRRRWIISRLKRFGIRIDARVTKCQPDHSTITNGKHPFIVEAKGTNPVTGRSARFQSDPVTVDLTQRLAHCTVPVLVSPEQPSRHYVDLSQWIDKGDLA